MSDLHLPSRGDESDDGGEQPEVRLELTRAGVQQVLSLYSQEQESQRSGFAFTLGPDDFLEAIRERRQTLLTGLVVGIGLALVLLWWTTPLYPVTAQVVLERHEISGDSRIGAGSGGSAFIATQAEIMQSPSVVSAAVAAVPRAAHLDPEDDAVADALESVEAAPVSGTQVVALGYLGPDALYGVRLLDAIVVAYRDVLRTIEGQTQEQKLKAKRAEIGVLEAEADAIQKELDELHERHPTWGSAEEAVEAQAAVLRDQSTRLTEVRNERIALENRLATGGKRLAILDPATRVLQERLWQAEAELARVQLTLRPRHPAVEAAQQEVEVLKRQLRANSEATPQALERDIAAARGLEEELAAVFEVERQRMAELERYRQDEKAFLSDLDRIRGMIDARRRELLDQRLLTRMAEAGEVGITARLIEAPGLPESPVWPRPRLILAIGAVLGTMGGFVMALVSLRRGRRVWVASTANAGEEPARS
ncbi:MAG TPA: hypothetical protein ENI85_13575 [Deltaproteobacteria bacterium]|nr:hypothetical protein [Deltaproteobacteria bacterium]